MRNLNSGLHYKRCQTVKMSGQKVPSKWSSLELLFWGQKKDLGVGHRKGEAWKNRDNAQ
jgi:hypothetical protein